MLKIMQSFVLHYQLVEAWHLNIMLMNILVLGVVLQQVWNGCKWMNFFLFNKCIFVEYCCSIVGLMSFSHLFNYK